MDDRCDFLHFCRETFTQRDVVNCGPLLKGISTGPNDLSYFLERSRKNKTTAVFAFDVSYLVNVD